MPRFAYLNDAGLPRVVHWQVDGDHEERALAFVHEHRQALLEELENCGALLFRQIHFNEASRFGEFAQIFCGALAGYIGGNSPRTRVAGNVMTATEYSRIARISLHNEASYLSEMPRRIVFYCERPATVGGQTLIADCRKIYSTLDESIRDQFEAKKVRYINTLHSGKGFGRSWHDVFQTDDKAAVERLLRRQGYEFEWRSSERLRTSIIADAVALHPTTREKVWINQAEQWHRSSLDPTLLECVRGAVGDDLPHDASFGDGSEIPVSDLEAIRRVMAAHESVVDCRAGDVLVCDNYLVAHGRRPFQGDRRVLVAMG